MKVCYFGIFKEDFTRTRVIKKALLSQGIEVITCVDHTPSLKKYIYLIKKHFAVRNDYDLMLVGFPGYFVMFLAWILTSKPIIFDSYISYYDGLLDRHDYSRSHPRLIVALLVDKFSAMCANVVLTINNEYKKFFINVLKIPSRKMEVLHKGADETIFYPRANFESSEKNKFYITWWGSYIPLHGVKYIIDSAILLKDQKNIEFHLIGNGQLKEKTKQKVKDSNLNNVVFHDSMSIDLLINEISKADVVLGLFNDSPKALRCVTNKVYEAIAMGKAVITENSPANSEIFTHKENACIIPPANPQALASAIKDLLGSPELRTTLSEGALELFQKHFTIKMIGIEFVDILRRHGLFLANLKIKV